MTTYRAIQLDLFTRPQSEIAESIRQMCDEEKRIKNVVHIGEIIKISPLLNLYFYSG